MGRRPSAANSLIRQNRLQSLVGSEDHPDPPPAPRSGSPLRSPPVAEEIRRRPLPEPYAFTKIKGIGSKSQGLEALPVKPAIGWIDIVEEGQMFDRVLG